MNKLVIHPNDRTTDFLKPIYHGRNDTTVITGDCTRADVFAEINKHDHIIMLGHGTPQGLLAMGKFNGKPKPLVSKFETPYTLSKHGVSATDDFNELDDLAEMDISGVKSFSTYRPVAKGYDSYYSDLSSGYVIDKDTANRLRNKKLTTIWCNADQYMEWNDLEGFYTGMFISDEGEAKMIGTADTEQWQVEESNYAFVSVVRRFLDHSPEKMRDALMMEYGELAERNAVAQYNLKRLYTRRAAQSGIMGL